MRVLVTGGAGYIGSMLVPKLLLAGHRVRVLDNLMFGGEGLLGIYSHAAFEFVPGDIRDPVVVRAALGGDVDAVIHLAALVGDPACAQDPEATRAINYQAVCDLIDLSRKEGIGRFVFVSTCSNYGISDTRTFADEETPLNPVSLYAETKVAAEQYVIGKGGEAVCSTVLRLATVFGLSPRMRFDLLLNQLVCNAVVDKRLMVYGPESWRPFLYVQDAVAALRLVLEAPLALVRGHVFNVGCGNYRKIDVIELIRRHIPDMAVQLAQDQKDIRNYKVSFAKIMRLLGFQPDASVETGILEIKGAIEHGLIRDPHSRAYGNIK